MTSALEGLLNGVGDGMNQRKDREMRERELAAYERSASARAEGPGISDGANKDGGPAGSTFVYDGKISDRPAYAYGRFLKAGIPAHVAAGLTGNLMQESGVDINPAAVGDNGNAFGGGQWNGPRKDAYMAYAGEKGVAPTDFDTQIDFLLHEGKTSERGAWDAIMATKTPEEAALVASQKFWRPGTPHNERRQAYATSIYANANQPAAPAQGPGVNEAIPTQDVGAKPWGWFRKFGSGVQQ